VEMWNSNSVVAWALAVGGADVCSLRPPPGGRAPGWNAGLVVAQRCRFVDLDGALFLKQDREHPMSYAGGIVSLPDRELWG